MPTLQITDIPQSLKTRITSEEWSSVSFASLEWVYRDGMDWIQYDEVLATQQDHALHDQIFVNKEKKFVPLEEAFDV